jgi:hypothetical protein
VPHGGYVLATLLRAAAAHLARTPSTTAHQPHTMTAQAVFARRTAAGRATVRVDVPRAGRATSTVHVAMSQGGRDLVLVYLTLADLRAEQGVGFPTGWALEPPPVPVDLRRLKAGTDPGWAEQVDMPFADFRRASQRVRFWFPRAGQRAKGSNDQWVCLREGGRFDNAALGFVADMFPQVVEGFNEEEDPYLVREKGVVEKLKKDGRRWARYWYPTVTMNLDVKKALPEEGVEFLFCRTSAKMIRNGRLDLEVVVLDEGGDLVAVSNHVVMVLSAGRNLAGRSTDGKGKSKM